MENSFHSKGSKNFVLKSDYLNNTNHSKKNSSFYEANPGSINQKSLFRNSVSFADPEDEENKKDKLKSIHVSDKELDTNLFNNIIFNDNNENNLNKNKSINHSNMIQDYYNMEENIELFNNLNLSNNEINEQNNNQNEKHSISNYFNNSNNLSPNGFKSNKSPNNLIISKNEYVNNINNINNNIENNDLINQNSFVNINQVLINQNNLNNHMLLNSLNNNNQNRNIYFSQNMNGFQNNNQIFAQNQKNEMNLLMLKKKEDNLINNCVTLCKEQIDCRLLQKMIDENPSIASSILYDKIKDKVQEISCDQFGNYFIQKVIEHLNINQIDELLHKKISPNFRSFCFNPHGTRVVQKIFEKIINNEELLNYYNLLLQPNLKDFVIDQNASHIIIKYVNMLQYPKNSFIIEFLLTNSFDLATKKHSCCVLQKCIEYSNEQQKKNFLKVIAEKSYGLFNDQYGNYVVQYCINLCDYDINKIFVDNFLNDIMKFSTQKYSSNIIEKCMDCCDEETKEKIIQKYCEPYIIEKLLFDMYGNYVLQKVMSLSKEPITSKYIEIIGPLMKKLSSYSFGPKLYNKLLSSFPSLSAYAGNKNESGKLKRMKSKKNNNNAKINNNMNNNEIEGFNGRNKNNINDLNNMNNNAFNNMYNLNNNMQIINMMNNPKNKFENGQILPPGMNTNNFYLPFQFGNNLNNNSNNMIFPNMLMNNNNFGMNYNNGNNMNNFIQFQQNQMNNNDNSIPNGSQRIFNFNNQQ